jgi:Uma2 family endonuclease
MTATLERDRKTKLTEAEYLELERNSEVRHEFIDGRMLEMPGPSKTHIRIVTNITVALAPPAHQQDCRFVASDGKLRSLQGRFYYPDVMICCLESTDTHIEDAPCFLLEVISPSTEAMDRGRKFDEYTSIHSLNQYVLVAQDEQRLTVFTRGESDWRVQSITEGAIQVNCLETELSLEQVYAGVMLEPDLTDSTDTAPTVSAEPTDP